MRITLHSRKRIALPSASAIEMYGDKLLVIGDDCSKLLVLNVRGGKVAEVALFKENSPLKNGRIAKSLKPDLEASVLLQGSVKKPFLLVLGSGSRRKKRDKGFQLFLPDSPAALTSRLVRDLKRREIDLRKLYDDLRSRLKKICKQKVKLNIEAAALLKDRLVLLHRGGSSSPNVSIDYALSSFCSWLDKPTKNPPKARLRFWNLPALEGIPSGFSGATSFRGRIYFLAAAEETDDPVLDGIVSGTLLGSMCLPKTSFKSRALRAEPIYAADKVLKLKLESITALKAKAGVIRALAVSDDDCGNSELLELRIST